MEYATGIHNITFQAMLNGEIRGSTTTNFIVTDRKLIYKTICIICMA